ncbi:MAG: addiction module protein [Chlorobaculum sp.]|nr:addiction module protein [Chlorobaculum sp.]
MTDLLKKIETEALSLSHQERAFLADRLLSSLGDDVHTDTDVAWIAEAERRYQEYKEGRRSGIDAKDVFAEADRILE